jgi:hypothetical protein
MTLKQYAAESRARARLKVYSRRWRVARDNERAYWWLAAHVRRMRVLERAVTLNDIVAAQWVPTEGSC